MVMCFDESVTIRCPQTGSRRGGMKSKRGEGEKGRWGECEELRVAMSVLSVKFTI
jgi:hypothetical protein